LKYYESRVIAQCDSTQAFRLLPLLLLLLLLRRSYGQR
jgi:hypothetical protein